MISLDVSRIESGRITYDMEKVAINEVVLEITNSFTASFSKEDVTLITKLNAPTGLNIFADNTRMRQVLNNIIGNALKFTKKGEVKVQTDYLEDKQTVEITVTDTGSGIPSELLPNLFGKFISNNVRTENKQGTGLGLFICRAIVNAHGGTITARNNGSGPGTIITISLPIHSLEVDRPRTGTANLTYAATQ
jgi:signal transduction histidine kinase